MKPTAVQFDSAFAEDTYKGLTSNPKFLYSKYFYDKEGDKLFQQIMDMPEYYLTNCEFNILKLNAEEIAEKFNSTKGFDLIELGAGDGKKTKLLLKEMLRKNFDFEYQPVDISQNVLDELSASLESEFPGIRVNPQQGTYFKTLEKLADYNKRKKVIVVLGSNIGNLRHKEAIRFLRNIAGAMGPDDMLFMGFDQKKHPKKILDAYNDQTGITEAFNKNMLKRLNRELDANFDLDQFMHWETYDPETGTAKSFLVSKTRQEVLLKNIDLKVNFSKWESIHTEISQKYDDGIVEWLAEQAGLEITTAFNDLEKCYKNYIFKVRS